MMKSNFTFNAKCINFYFMVSAFCSLSPQIMKIVSYVHSRIFDLTGIFVYDIVNQLHFFTFNTPNSFSAIYWRVISFLLLCIITFVKIWNHIWAALFPGLLFSHLLAYLPLSHYLNCYFLFMVIYDIWQNSSFTLLFSSDVSSL